MNIVIVGGGPAGMMAAMSAKEQNRQINVILIEKNNQLGKKLLITGKGRCNVTSSLNMQDFIKNIPGNGKFLYSVFNEYTNEDIISFLNQQGLEVKEERGNRIFPITDKSLDVLKCFTSKLKELGIEIKKNTVVEDILIEEINGKKTVKGEKVRNIESESVSNANKISNKLVKDGVEKNKSLNNHQNILADKVIIATGGKSYPLTGSTGDGYVWAEKLGHKIVDLRPSLVPLEIYEKDLCHNLQGLSLKNVSINIVDLEKNKIIYEDFGEMLFTHFGVSGPIILSASAHLVRYKNIMQLLKNKKIVLNIDFKPALSDKKLDDRILRDFSEFKNKQFKNALDKLLPQKLIPVVIKRSGISLNKKVNEITKEERRIIVKELKQFSILLSNFRPIDEAIITAGGVSVKDINPKTMESKIVDGLFFAGEIIDVDAYTGGFNLQIAYSTGFVAGI